MEKAQKTTQKRNWMLYGVILIAIIALALVFIKPGADTAQAFPSEVSPKQTAEMQSAGAFLLDVREPDEWAAGHIEGATLIPLGELPNRLSEVPQDQEVVVVCRSGRRSAEGRDILRNAGYSTVTSMSGGMNLWIAQDLPVVTGN